MTGTPLTDARAAWPDAILSTPDTMRALVFDQFGGPDVLRVAERPTPRPGPEDVIVRVAAVSVGRLLDLETRAGTNPIARVTFPHVLGAEHSGTVVAVGANVPTSRLGEHVAVFPVLTCGECRDCRAGHTEACFSLRLIGVHREGAYAEYAASPAVNAHVVPAGTTPVDAAALALAGPVAENQLRAASITVGGWVLVQGGGSSLGSLTAALAVSHQARVISTSRSSVKRRQLLNLGVEVALNPTADDFVDAVMAVTGGRGVEVAIDDLGHPAIWDATMQVLATRGTAVTSGAFLGKSGVHLDLMRLYLRSQRIVGVRTGNAASAALLWEQVAAGFRPIVDRTFPISVAADAHRYMESGGHFGRIVLTTSADQDWEA